MYRFGFMDDKENRVKGKKKEIIKRSVVRKDRKLRRKRKTK